MVPNHPFICFFPDESLDQTYRAEAKTGFAISRFCALAVFLARLDLFGLVSPAAQQQTREIGIRKALGASIQGIVALATVSYQALKAAAANPLDALRCE
jgi:putative ABC transport system permease protein